MFKKLLLGSAAAASLVVATAGADATVYLRVIENGVTIFNSSSATGTLTYSGATANFLLSTASVTGAPILPQPGLATMSMQITPLSSTTSTLAVIFSQDGLTACAGCTRAFTTNSTFNGLLGTGSGTSTGYVGANAFDQTTQISNMNAVVLGVQSNTTAALLAAPTYSETVRYDFSFTGASNVVNASTQVISAPVPEAATWAMMLVGFGGIGAALRSGRRSRTVTFA